MVELADSTDLGSVATSVRVRVPPPAPNKSDNFDTIGIETIRLILFLKMLMAQGFSAPVPFLLVSL